MSIKDYFKPIGVDKSIVIASSEAANLNPRKRPKLSNLLKKEYKVEVVV